MNQEGQNPNLESAIEALRQGELVGIPTETVYGLAGSIFQPKALHQIFALKERPFFDPLIVHIAHLRQREKVVREWPPLAEALAARFWPGPLTIVLPKHPTLSHLITSGLDSVGLRMPSHPVARELIERLDQPLAAPSANKFGKTSPTTAAHVRESFPGLLVLDGGDSQVGLESSVVRLEGGAVALLRPGAITEERLREFLEPLGVQVIRTTSQASPGHLEHHYQPDVPLYIVERKMAQGEELKLPDDPRLAARVLYAQMRTLAGKKPNCLYVIRSSFQRGGLWEAIWDRLERAATK